MFIKKTIFLSNGYEYANLIGLVLVSKIQIHLDNRSNIDNSFNFGYEYQ